MRWELSDSRYRTIVKETCVYEKRWKSQEGLPKPESQSKCILTLVKSDIVVIILIQTKNQKQKPEKIMKTNSINVFQEHLSNSKNNQNQTS